MYLYIIRHGETYGNLNGDGFTETDLTENGLNQARLLGERLKNEKIDNGDSVTYLKNHNKLLWMYNTGFTSIV